MKNLISFLKDAISKHRYFLLLICLSSFLFWLFSTGIKYYEQNEINKSKAEIISRINDLFQNRDTVIFLMPPESNYLTLAEVDDTNRLDSIKKAIGDFKKQFIFSESEDSSFYYFVYIRYDMDYFMSYKLKPESYFDRKQTVYKNYYDIIITSVRNAFENKYQMENEGDSIVNRHINIKGKYHLLQADYLNNSIKRTNRISVTDTYSNGILEYSMNPIACFTITRDEAKLFKYFGLANLAAFLLSFAITSLIIYYFFLRHKRKKTKKQ